MRRRGKTARTSQRQPARGFLARALCLGMLALALVTAGCSGKTRIKDPHDPLINGQPPLPPPKGAGATIKSRSGVPPVPEVPTSSSLSNAALAAKQRLQGSPDLAIPEKRPTSSGGWRGNGTPFPGDNSNPVLRRPEPIVEPVPRITTPAPPAPVPSQQTTAPPAPAPTPPSLETLQAELNRRGMVWQVQQPTPQGVLFLAAFPSPDNPSSQRIYEATAATPEQAILAVLQQLR